jgi:7TMR-DISM extracellular 2
VRFHLSVKTGYLLLILTVFLCTVLSLTLVAENAQSDYFVLTNESQEINLSGNIQYLMDDLGEYTIADLSSQPSSVQFIPSKDKKLDFGLTDSFVWLKFRVKNRSIVTDWILEFNIHKFYTVEIYSSQEDSPASLIKSFRYTQAFADREIQKLILRLTLRFRKVQIKHSI